MTVADRLSAAVSDALVAVRDVERQVEEITDPFALAHLAADLGMMHAAAAAARRKVCVHYLTVRRIS